MHDLEGLEIGKSPRSPNVAKAPPRPSKNAGACWGYGKPSHLFSLGGRGVAKFLKELLQTQWAQVTNQAEVLRVRTVTFKRMTREKETNYSFPSTLSQLFKTHTMPVTASVRLCLKPALSLRRSVMEVRPLPRVLWGSSPSEYSFLPF